MDRDDGQWEAAWLEGHAVQDSDARDLFRECTAPARVGWGMSTAIPTPVTGARREVVFALGWLDAIRGPYLLLLVTMVAVGGGASWSIATGETPASLAWMNGLAAVITAAAALTEARSARSLRLTVADHEVRIRVLETLRGEA